MVMHGLFERLARQHRMECSHYAGAVFGGQQVQVVQVVGQRLAWVKAKQCLGAP
jgi:hypothetical protein